MLDPTAERRPRDWNATLDLLEQTQDEAKSLGECRAMVAHVSLHPYRSALSRLKLTNMFAAVRYDSLHVCDGGITMRILIIIGNHLYHRQPPAAGDALLRLVNRRLAAMPRHDDFTHFGRPLWALDPDKKACRRVKQACNYRCTEYQQLLQQAMYSYTS